MAKIAETYFIAALLIMMLSTAASCSSLNENHQHTEPEKDARTEEELHLVAVVKWIPLEGGFYGLVSEDGQNLLPLNLPDTFKKDGLKVTVKGRKKDAVTIYMWGAPFEIHQIERGSPKY